MGKVTRIKANKDSFGNTTVLSSPARKKLVAAYCRVSTGSDEQKLSFDSQVEYYTKLIQGNPEWEFAGIYSDLAISGTKASSRPGFQKMIEDARMRRFDMVICKSISRFARNTVDTLQHVRMLKEIGIEVFFEEENIHTLTMDGELLLTVLSSVAQQESENLSEHVRAGLQHKMANGVLIGFSGCYGYRYNREDRSLSIVEEEAEVVRYIYQRYLDGYGTTTIVNELNDRNIPTKHKKGKWIEATVRGILANEKYTGDILLGKTYTTDPIAKKRTRNNGESDKYLLHEYHPAIIPKEQFDKVQEMRRQRREEYGSLHGAEAFRYRTRYALSSICTCGFCGGECTRRKQHSGSIWTKATWACRNRIKKGRDTCPSSKDVDEEAVRKAFVECFNILIKEKYDEIQTVFDRSEKELNADESMRLLRDNVKRQKVLEERFSKLMDLLADEKITTDEYEAKVKEIEGKMRYLKSEYEDVSNTIKIKKEGLESIREFRKKIKETGPLDEFDETVFKLMVDHVILGGVVDGVEHPYLITFIFTVGMSGKIEGLPFKQDNRKKAGMSSHTVNKEDVICSFTVSDSSVISVLRNVRPVNSGRTGCVSFPRQRSPSWDCRNSMPGQNDLSDCNAGCLAEGEGKTGRTDLSETEPKTTWL